MNPRLLVGFTALVGLAMLPLAWAAPHPFYDDGGMIKWRAWPQALTVAQQTGRPIFLEVSKDNDGNSKKLATTTLRDERIAQFVNRYYVPVSVDFAKQPLDLKATILKAGKTPPMIILMGSGGQYITGLAGYKKPNEVEPELMKVLEDKAFALPKSREAEMDKNVKELEKLLGDKAWPKAAAEFKSILAVRGYSPLKDQAYDLLDKAQLEGTQELKTAYDHARQDEYAEAKKSIDKVLKDYAGAPIADQAKDHLAAVKLLETAHQYATDTKVPRKNDALRQLESVSIRYADTPYGGLATARKKDLAPATPAKPAGK